MTDDSVVKLADHGTVFAGKDAVELFRAVTLKRGIMLLQKGIIPNRGWTMTKALNMVTHYSQKPYKRGQASQALADLEQWIVAMRAAMPVEDERTR